MHRRPPPHSPVEHHIARVLTNMDEFGDAVPEQVAQGASPALRRAGVADEGAQPTYGDTISRASAMMSATPKETLFASLQGTPMHRVDRASPIPVLLHKLPQWEQAVALAYFCKIPPMHDR